MIRRKNCQQLTIFKAQWTRFLKNIFDSITPFFNSSSIIIIYQTFFLPRVFNTDSIIGRAFSVPRGALPSDILKMEKYWPGLKVRLPLIRWSIRDNASYWKPPLVTPNGSLKTSPKTSAVKIKATTDSVKRFGKMIWWHTKNSLWAII